MRTLRKTIRIKNCPSFVDYSPPANLTEFKRFNLIYGWNGSGKTTFTRILRSFELGINYFDNKIGPPEFGFVLDDNSSINQTDLTSLKGIRVFNKDFVDENVFCVGGPRPIFFLGKKSIKEEEQILKSEKELDSLREEAMVKKTILDKTKDGHLKSLTDKAREIKNTLTTPVPDKYHNYERTNLEGKISQLGNDHEELKKHKLSPKELASLKKSIMQTSKPKISTTLSPNLDIKKIEKTVQELLNKTVVSQVIGSLKSDEGINQWVEHGLALHKSKKIKTCAFCNQAIPPSRLSDLEKHFNDEYQRTLEDIKRLKIELENRKVNIDFLESSDFYDDITPEYLSEKKSAEKSISEFNQEIERIISVLDDKEKNLFKSHPFNSSTEIKTDSFGNIEELIKRHNIRTINFDKQIQDDKKKIEAHYVLEFLPSYLKSAEECQALSMEYEEIHNLTEKKGNDIKTLKENLISHHISAQQINSDLSKFLDREDIQIKAQSDGGYEITRNGQVASNLSEGEKTALAIVYFLAKIKEDGFDLKDGIIVIDDPVSSLDSSAIFQSFSFIKNAVGDAKQLFILTHHFDFFRQVKNWFKFINGHSTVSYFMMVCEQSGVVRSSSLVDIDPLLIKYESEYHFLFSILYRFDRENKKELEEMYRLPNIARKFLESFLAFRVPIGSKEPNIRQRLEKIKGDKSKKERVVRFAETHSHPHYESGMQDFDMTILSETPNAIKDLLDLVEEEDKRHYDFLVESIN